MKKRTIFLGLLLSIFILGIFQSFNNDTKEYDIGSYSMKNSTQNKDRYRGDLKLSGRTTMMEIIVEEETSLDISFDIHNVRGIFKIVMTDNDNFIEKIAVLNGMGKISDKKEIKLTPGTYVLKFVGIGARSKPTLKFTYDKTMLKINMG